MFLVVATRTGHVVAQYTDRQSAQRDAANSNRRAGGLQGRGSARLFTVVEA